MNIARLFAALASVFGGGLPVDRWGRALPELPAAAPELPAADRARLDAAAARRARRGAARVSQTLRAAAGARRAATRLLLLAILAALLGCAPDGECIHGERQGCAPCSVGGLHTNLPGSQVCIIDGGVATWGVCRCVR